VAENLGATNNIATLRIFATALLVAYHVIGIGEGGGMEVSDSSGWRFAADLLVDLRMPLFAFIAGCVYALRPLDFGNAYSFIVGKTKRLVLPGVIAAVIFWVLGNSIFPGAFSTGARLIEAITLSYGHFWFLQAVLILFLTIGVLDTVLRYRAAAPMLVAACILQIVWQDLGVQTPPELQLTSAVYLSPGFLMGIVTIRHGNVLAERTTFLASVATLFLMAGLLLNFQIFWETGRLSRDRMDLQSLLVGVGAIILLYIFMPRIAWADRLATMAFTIYLYHPFGTSLARRLFNSLEIDAGLVRFVGGLIIGFVIPILLHMLALRSEMTRRLFLGLRDASRSANSRVERQRSA
jgi:fucose 4-O-acetylase-like acetyltransferase